MELHEQTLRPGAGQTIDVSPELQPIGAVTISSNPSAEVYIDGSLIGSTPLAGVPVFAGQHRLELRPSGPEAARYGTYSGQFEVEPWSQQSLGPFKLPPK